MKMRVIALLVLVAIMLSGCFLRLFNTEEPYEFRQEFDQIVSIEILRIDYSYSTNSTNVIKVIDPSMHQAVIDGLLEIPGGRVVLDPPSDLGVYIFRIRYQDGECELIGNSNNGFVTPGGEMHEKNYVFQDEPFYELLSRFLGEKVTD
jgi:hypothetical protein